MKLIFYSLNLFLGIVVYSVGCGVYMIFFYSMHKDQILYSIAEKDQCFKSVSFPKNNGGQIHFNLVQSY